MTEKEQKTSTYFESKSQTDNISNEQTLTLPTEEQEQNFSSKTKKKNISRAKYPWWIIIICWLVFGLSSLYLLTFFIFTDITEIQYLINNNKNNIHSLEIVFVLFSSILRLAIPGFILYLLGKFTWEKIQSLMPKN